MARFTKPRYRKDGSYAKGGEPRPIKQVLPGKPAWYRDLWSSKENRVIVNARKSIAPYLLALEWLENDTKTAYPLWVPLAGHTCDTRPSCAACACLLWREPSLCLPCQPHLGYFPLLCCVRLLPFLCAWTCSKPTRPSYRYRDPMHKWGYLVPKGSQTSGTDPEAHAEGVDEELRTTAVAEWVDDNAELQRHLTHTFVKLPHKGGPEANCGNPMAKDYIRWALRLPGFVLCKDVCCRCGGLLAGNILC